MRKRTLCNIETFYLLITVKATFVSINGKPDHRLTKLVIFLSQVFLPHLQIHSH